MSKFISRPQKAEARQFIGEASYPAIADWVSQSGKTCFAKFIFKKNNRFVLKTTLMSADIEIGDWIIINENGVVFMASDSAFKERYSPADETLDPAGGSHENPLGD